MKFKKGTHVKHGGYEGVVADIRNKEQRYVRMPRGMIVVDIHDLKYWKK